VLRQAQGRLRPELVDPFAHLLEAAMMEMALRLVTDLGPRHRGGRQRCRRPDLLARLTGG